MFHGQIAICLHRDRAVLDLFYYRSTNQKCCRRQRKGLFLCVVLPQDLPCLPAHHLWGFWYPEGWRNCYLPLGSTNPDARLALSILFASCFSTVPLTPPAHKTGPMVAITLCHIRSEERRVGKECISMLSTEE